MPRQLTITPAPFKSSYLAIPPTPFSPRLPITPFSPPPKDLTAIDRAAKLRATADLLPPPCEPLHWLWQCHRCNRVYQLGVTRRCLDDGHFFCAGSTVIKRSKKHNYKKVVRHQACASEFDYQGWKAWGTWRRQVAEQVEAAEALLRAEEGMAIQIPIVPDEGKWFGGAWTRKAVGSGMRGYWERRESGSRGRKDCWDRCDYPSECRWGKQFGVQTPTTLTAAMVVPSTKERKTESPPTPPALREENITAAKPKTSFDDILLSIADPASPDYLEPLEATTSNTATPLEPDTAAPSMDDLLQSAKRRKRRSSGQIPLVPSPLGANPPSPEEEKTEEKVVRKSSSESALLDTCVEENLVDKKKSGLGDELREEKDAFVRSWKGARAKVA